MNRNILEAVMLAAFAGKPPAKPTVRVVDKPEHTRNLFGPIEEVAGKDLELLERNDRGDCLCIFKGRMGTNIVDVDYRDVRTVAAKSRRSKIELLRLDGRQ